MKSPGAPETAQHSPLPLGEGRFETRAARARLLAPTSIAAATPLRFAAGLYDAQAKAVASLEESRASTELTGRLEQDAAQVVNACRNLLRFVAKEGPPALAQTARLRANEDPQLQENRLRVYWSGDRDAGHDFLSRSILRPYVELLARLKISPDRAHRAGHCPFCGGAPWIGVRRAISEADGAQRLLACSLCGGEWPLNRIRCPSCSEDNPDHLPCFQTETYPSVRIEACETCHRYVKSIDLSLDARSIPEVDDLLSLGMDLWAVQEGFTRIEPGLAGV